MTEGQETRFELGSVLIAVAVLAIVAAVCAGLFIGFWATIIVTAGFGLIAVAALVVWATRRPHPPAEAPHVKPLDDGRYRVLVVADGRATPHFADQLRTRAGGRPVTVL